MPNKFNKKYKINGEGRIVALRAIGLIATGTIGGYVATETREGTQLGEESLAIVNHLFNMAKIRGMK